jgi:tetratricopeptide (TPR) repeat protein
MQGPFIRLLAAAAERALRLVEHPPIITALTSSGSSITIHSYITGAAKPLTQVNFEAVHISIVAALALALSVPNRWPSRARMCALALALVFFVTLFVCVAQLKMAAESYATARLGITLHTAGERDSLDWMIRKSSLAIVFVAPAFLFLTAYVFARSSPGGEAGNRASRSRRPPRVGWRRTTATLGGCAAAGLLVAWLPADRAEEVHLPGLLRIAELNPTSPGIRMILARYFEEAGNREESLRSYQQALRLNPDLVGAHFGAGNIHFRTGAYEQAARCYGEVLRREPANLEARHNLGTAYLSQNLFDLAARSYEEVLRARPDYASAHRNLGAALVGLKQPCVALAHFERSVALDEALLADGALRRAMVRLRSTCGQSALRTPDSETAEAR